MQRGIEVFEQQRPVRQPRQGVMGGEVLQLGPGAVQVRHVVEVGDHPDTG